MKIDFECELEFHDAPLLFQYIRILGAKRTMWRREAGLIDTVVLGSSHGDFSFNPKYFRNSFNMCCRSQDLKYSFLLHDRLSRYCPKIKNIILYYSIFSPGGFSELSPVEGEIFPALNELFRLGVDYSQEKLSFLAKKISGKLNEYSIDIDGFRGFFPSEGKVFIPESDGAEKRVEDHLRFNRITGAHIWLVRMILLAKKLKQNIYIVIPPVRSDYKSATRKLIGGNMDVLFSDLHDVVSNYNLDYECKILNFMDSDKFKDEHFGDFDHMLPEGEGVEILANLIFDEVKSNQNRKWGRIFKRPVALDRGSGLLPILPTSR